MTKFPLSVRDKNLAFIERLRDVFCLDSDGHAKPLAEYKKAFTAAT
jgi:hypothetical protein